jgi:hypothetical protein
MSAVDEIKDMSKIAVTEGFKQGASIINGKERTPKQVLYWARFHTITNILLIVAIIFLVIFAWKNIEDFKTLGRDVCKMCMEKTGATCFVQPIGANISPEVLLTGFNLSKEMDK